MSLQKKPALRRNYSEQKMVKAKDYALPTLVKGQQLTYSSQNLRKHNFEPFKLRALNCQDKKSESGQQTPSSPLRHQKQQTFQRNAPQVKIIQKQSPKPVHIENILDPFLKDIRPQIAKRRTMFCGDFSLSEEKSQSQQGSLQSINSQQQVQQRPERRSLFKRITRKFSLTTLPTNTSEIKQLGTVEKKSNFCNKEAKKQMQKLLFYHQFLRQQTELHDISLKTVSSYQDQIIHYSLGKGNNRQMIKEVMNKRWWWKEAEKEKGDFVNFQWTQLKDLEYIAKNEPQNELFSSTDSFEDEQIPLAPQPESEVSARTLHNHFQCNKYLGSKLSLYLTLKNYCNQKGLLVSDLILPTFYVSRMMDDQWKSFTKAYFERLQISRIDNWDVNINKKYWMVKQFNTKEGQNTFITNKIFTTYKEIKQHVEKQCKNGSKFLIQKYISKPFLFKRRKFDIRAFALVVRLKQKINVYLHRQGIISTATEPFDMAQIDNEFAHMTTESVQIANKKFGEYEPGNKIDFHSFQSYLEVGYGQKYNFMQQAFPKMQEVLSHFVKANYSLISNSRHGSCFELIQCEFTMDEDFKPWLIDVHTNPCLQTYCVVLEKVLPVVIEDAFKHTIDVIFPPPLQWPQNKRHLLPVKGKDDGFVLIFDESKLEEKDKKRPQDVDAQIVSDRDVYMDGFIIDDFQNGNLNCLSGLQYLMNEAMELE